VPRSLSISAAIRRRGAVSPRHAGKVFCQKDVSKGFPGSRDRLGVSTVARQPTVKLLARRMTCARSCRGAEGEP
jgi:hypothetical protein